MRRLCRRGRPAARHGAWCSSTHVAAGPSPGRACGESGDELAARTRRALRGTAAQAGSTDAVVIAHGASIRAALAALTGQPDPGRDLATGDVARLSVTCDHGSAAHIALTAWA